MIKPQYNLNTVKEKIKSYCSKSVDVKVNLGRNKTAYFSGVLTNAYPALFTIMPDDAEYKGRTSYSYSELLCGKVKIREKQISSDS